MEEGNMSIAAKGETWQVTTTQSAISIILVPIFRAGLKRLAGHRDLLA